MPHLVAETRPVKVGKLQTFHRNPRRGNIAAIADSLKTTGQYKPIIVNKGTHTGRPHEVLAGNHTLQAARTLHWETVLASYVDVDDETANRIVLADNRTADLGDYDDDLLASLLKDLPTFAGTGYTSSDLDALLRDQPTALPYTPEEAEAAPDFDETPPVAAVGDVWRAGRHWVACGDSTDPAFVAELAALAGKADAVWTDPPYGVDYVGGNHSLSAAERKAKGGKTIGNDGAAGLPAFLTDLFTATTAITKPGAPTYIAHADTERINFETTATDAGWSIRQNLIWVKNSLVMGRSDHHYRHEPILYGFAPGGDGRLGRGGTRWYGDNAQTTVFEIDRPSRNKDHPTMKPVALIVAQLKNSLAPGGTVYDPCAGSGSTLIAADTLSSTAVVTDLDPRYVDVILKRYETLTGTFPVKHSNLLEQAG